MVATTRYTQQSNVNGWGGDSMISPPDPTVFIIAFVFLLAGFVSWAVAVAAYFIQKRSIMAAALGAMGAIYGIFAYRYAQLTLPGFPGYPIPSADGRPYFLAIGIAAVAYPILLYVSGGRELKMILAHSEQLAAKQRTVEFEKEILRHHISQAEARNAEQQQMFQEFKYLILTNVGHELRTPITFILGFVRMIIDGTFGQVEGTSLHEPMEQVHTSTRRLFAVIKRMLTATLRDPDFAPTDIALIGQQALADRDIWLNTRRNPADVTLTSDIPDKLPIVGDQDMLRTAIVELLNNAIKFGATHIRLTISEEDGEAVVQVHDNGIDVARESHRDIFEPYCQVQMDSNRQYEGTGAGLAAVENVARKHRGHAFVQNPPSQQKGAIFNFIIPVNQTAQSAVPPVDVAPDMEG